MKRKPGGNSLILLKQTDMKHKYFTCLVILFSIAGSAVAQKIQPVNKQLNKTNLVKFNNIEPRYQQLQNDMKQLVLQKEQMLNMMRAINEKQKLITENLKNLEGPYDSMTGGIGAAGDGVMNSQQDLMSATKSMQETQMSFNLQYLQLQNTMQNENRQFTMVSNIMKTKHDTVKNSISNIR